MEGFQKLLGAIAMQQQQPHEVTESRRKFLIKGTAGLVIASLPARSVWASGGGVAQSIIASGHSSDFAGGTPIKLLSPGYWKTHQTTEHTTKFKDIFGGKAFSTTGGATMDDNVTFGQILTTKGSAYKGVSTVNFHLVAMYLNAKYSGQFGLNFPVFGAGKPFTSLSAFASYLYTKALLNPSGVGTELNSLITNYHV